MSLAPNWQRALLKALGAPITAGNLQFLNQWHLREGGGDKNTAHWNPLNTTQSAKGATSMNSVGVKAYRSAQQGINATVQTLLNGHYDDIVRGLRSGTATAAMLASSPSLKVWGTGTWGSESARAGAGGATAASLPLPEGESSALVKPSYTIEDVAHEGLQALASGTYDPTKGLAALQRAATATQSAMLANMQKGDINFGSMVMPVIGPQGSKFGSRAARMVQDYLNTPYVWGAENPQVGFDCSSLLQWVWGKLGVKIPRVTYDQWKTGRSVKRGQLRPGDAVFFRPGKRGPEHVGMYIGGGQFVEAPHTGAVVRISSLKGRGDYMGARRYA